MTATRNRLLNSRTPYFIIASLMARNLLSSLMRRLRPPAPGDDPVFLFAASWRTGSTLLQRIICASRIVFLWGEPRFLPQLLKLHKKMLVVQHHAYRTAGHFSDYRPGAWIPTLFPERDRIAKSFRSFLRELYFEPVLARGYSRWGFKEVRPDAVEAARFLHTLYPYAKFIFLVRNPLDTYLSVKNMRFFTAFRDPLAPVANWRKNAAAFREVIHDGELPAILVRYEDLVTDESSMTATIQRICSHLDLAITPEMLHEVSFKVGARPHEKPLTAEERGEILSQTREEAAQVGYELPG